MRLKLDDATANQWREILPFDGSAALLETFVEPTMADEMFASLLTEIPWSAHELVLFGKKLTEPRLSAWIADVGISYTYSRVERRPETWTPTLTKVRTLCEMVTRSSFNSVLANLYRSGADSMGWHADDEPELGPEPTIASVSLGDERRFDFRHRVTGEVASVLLPHGSLLVMSGATQACWKHRIARTKSSTSQRINLTYRFVRTPHATKA